MTTAKLEPCPWCECTKFVRVIQSGFSAYVYCDDCGAQGPKAASRMVAKQDAITAWNTRAIQRAAAPDDRLREVVRKCAERFREYEAGHRAKASKARWERDEFEIVAKAERNREMVELIETTLSTLDQAPSPLVEFFRGPGFNDFGKEGDYHGWPTEQTAVHFLSEYLKTLHPPEWPIASDQAGPSDVVERVIDIHKLEPCPLCDGTEFELRDIDSPPLGSSTGSIKCRCGLQFSGKFHERLASVTVRWNTRAARPTDELREALEPEPDPSFRAKLTVSDEMVRDGARAIRIYTANQPEENTELPASQFIFNRDDEIARVCLTAALEQPDAEKVHRSDCAIYNEPESPAGECDCGMIEISPTEQTRCGD